MYLVNYNFVKFLAHSTNSKFDENALLWELDLVGGDEQTDREELSSK
jgi:hypothetical protein